jgi:hypothetical protein
MANPLKDSPGIQPELVAILAQPPIADSVAATLPALVTDFNALLAALRKAGIIST